MGLEVASVRPAGTVGHAPRDEAEWKANASLVAAAPDLLARLKDVTRILEAGTYTVGLGKGQIERLAQAKAAIRLAETGERS